jgi:hypothetical protein
MHKAKETVLRTTVLLGDGERPEFPAGQRTTLVVTRAVLEDVVGGTRKLMVYGYCKERPKFYAGYDNPGNEPRSYDVYPDRYCPASLLPLLREMEYPLERTP